MSKQKPKAAEPSLRDKLSQAFLRAFQTDFEEHGVNVIEQLRKVAPEKYADIAAKLIAASQAAPSADEYADTNSIKDLGRRFLLECGANEYTITDDMIDDALAAHEQMIERLGEIVARGAN